jgi:hypothetical protein
MSAPVITLIGGPTVLIEANGFRLLTDPTFDAAAAHHAEEAHRAGAHGKSSDITWRAYLSTQGTGAVNARDRIGKGPWQNTKGIVIANDVAELHGANNLNKQTALTEKRDGVNGVGDTPNRHDVLTGSQVDGTAFLGADDRTCQ